MFKDKLREARKAQKMTQKELSALLKVSDNAISNWEKGVSRPDIDQVAEICTILKVSPNYLIDSEEIETVISIDDKRILNKYHLLDQHGKKMVNMVLDEEYNRCQEQEETVKVYRVAQSDDDHPAEIEEMKRSELNRLHSLPMTDEDL